MWTSDPPDSPSLLDTLRNWLRGQKAPEAVKDDVEQSPTSALDGLAVTEELKSIKLSQLSYLSTPLEVKASPSDSLVQLRSEIDALLESRRADGVTRAPSKRTVTSG